MMRIALLIIIVSANCVKMNCDEELNTTENINGVSETTELKSGDKEPLQINTENKEIEKEASKSSEDNEEIRISRSSPEHSTEKDSHADDLSTLLSTEASLTEKSTIDEINSEQKDSQVNKEVKQLTRRMNSPSVTEEVEKSLENTEKNLEELPKISTASKIEDKKPEDLSEASAESKLSDSEKASSNVHVTDRKSKTKDTEENSDELLLNENRGTRRMFSATDNIVIDSKMRAGTPTTVLEPDVKTALKQNFNTYSNYKEFGTEDNIKLTDSSRTKPSIINEKTNVPVVAKLAPQEVFDQRYIPKSYPRPELSINFPNVNSDFQGPQDLPIYLKVKQEENHFKGLPTSQYQSTYKSNFINPNKQQQSSPLQRSLHTQGTFPNKQLENVQVDMRNQGTKLYQNQASTGIRGYIESKQLTNLNQESLNQIRQHYQIQEKNPNYNNFGNVNLEVRNEDIQETSKMPLNINDPGNQYPYYEPQGMIHKKIKLENKQLGTERFPSPNSYFQQPSLQQVILNNPRNEIDIIPANVKMLFQKLARASLFPRKLTTSLYSNSNIQNPYLINPGFTADFSVYGLGYIPGF